MVFFLSMNDKQSSILSDEEIARRRDEVVRRMANTPPQPKQKKVSKATKRGKRSRKGETKKSK